MSFALDEFIRVDPEFAHQLDQLRRKLVAIYKSSKIDSVKELDAVLVQLRQTAESFVHAEMLLENKCHIKRLLLEFQYVAALKLYNYPLDYVEKVIEELELVGFPYPTRWADMLLELADQHELRNNSLAARKIRKRVAQKIEHLHIRVEGIRTNLRNRVHD